MAEKKIPLQSSTKEQDLLKSIFKDNEYLLKLMRSVFLGFDLIKEEKVLLTKTFKNEELLDVVRKKFYPSFTKDAPIGQFTDFWLGVETQIFGASRDTINQAVNSKLLVRKLLEQAFELLKNPDLENIILPQETPLNLDELQVNLLARILYMKTVETGLHYIKIIVDTPEKTAEEIKASAKLNSSK